eukprot:129347-Chlamydomonas_euryale.AAC.2
MHAGVARESARRALARCGLCACSRLSRVACCAAHRRAWRPWRQGLMAGPRRRAPTLAGAAAQPSAAAAAACRRCFSLDAARAPRTGQVVRKRSDAVALAGREHRMIEALHRT